MVFGRTQQSVPYIAKPAGPKRWHQAPDGSLSECSANQGPCPYEGKTVHVEAPNLESAYREFEKYRQSFTEKPKSARKYVNLSPEGKPTLTPREYAERLDKLASLGEGPFDLVEMKAFISLGNKYPVLLRRQIGKNGPEWMIERETGLRNPGFKDSPEILRTKDNRLLLRRTLGNTISENEVRAFIEDGSQKFDVVTYTSDDPYARDETIYKTITTKPRPLEVLDGQDADQVREEVVQTVLEYMRITNNEENVSDRKKKSHAMFISRFGKDESGALSGSVDFANSGFRPEHFSGVDTGEKEVEFVQRFLPRPDKSAEDVAKFKKAYDRDYVRSPNRSLTGFGNSFKVQDSTPVDGAAEWKISRKGNQWEVKVRGTRGNLETIVTSDPEQAEKTAQSFMEKFVRPANYATAARAARKKLADFGPQESKSDFSKSRASFIGRFVKNGNSLADRAVQNQQTLSRLRQQLP